MYNQLSTKRASPNMSLKEQQTPTTRRTCFCSQSSDRTRTVTKYHESLSRSIMSLPSFPVMLLCYHSAHKDVVYVSKHLLPLLPRAMLLCYYRVIRNSMYLNIYPPLSNVTLLLQSDHERDVSKYLPTPRPSLVFYC